MRALLISFAMVALDRHRKSESRMLSKALAIHRSVRHLRRRLSRNGEHSVNHRLALLPLRNEATRVTAHFGLGPCHPYLDRFAAVVQGHPPIDRPTSKHRGGKHREKHARKQITSNHHLV